MRRAVVDTNVLLVANGDHADISEDCVITCIEAINRLAHDGVTVIDDEWRILGEYHNKLSPNHGQPRPGDVFLKHLLRQQSNTARVFGVSITESADDWFEEFPDHELQRAFDPPDRKFIAVAAADAGSTPVLQAADCKWLDWWQPLSRTGVLFRFICQNDMRRFYAQKFADRILPSFPPDE